MAVIASAVQDLKKPTRAGKESVWARESARAFLTVSNPNLKFWCGVANFDMTRSCGNIGLMLTHPD
jgi:hypothetical protein